ncbi:S-type pyocin domain-containing protein [Pseudomonas sp. SWRI154]|uniref:S-type pyocin domain-containing protein n=1 Tax=Pseudomonas sp. SWRI154 TaxID=2745501 RepID=UPI00164914B0|nr:S-type pyocin domain-containing protein [Pseudomonas sp. SWRI154]MBC3363242.1 S-type pyocin domain-containing protein [Pseudomonas sp. SWRI154]
MHDIITIGINLPKYGSKGTHMPQEKNIIVNRGIPRTPSSSSGFGFSVGRVSGPDHGDRAYDAVDYAFEWLYESNESVEESFKENIKNIKYITDAELAKTRATVRATAAAGTAAFDIELRALNLQLSQKKADHQQQLKTANLYYGHDPLTHKARDSFHKGFELNGRRGGPRGYYKAIAQWNVSYAAAYQAKFLAEQIKLLNGRLATQNKIIAQTKAKAAAAAQAKAQAEAEAEAKRAAAEKARKAAEAEAKRAAEERARIAAIVAAKQAREAAMALWDAERWAEADELEAEEARRQAEVQKARQPARATRTFPVSGSAAAVGPVFTIAGGTLAPNPATASGITDELRSAVSAILETVAATALPAVAWFAALADPSELGNGERYALSIPLSELAPANTDDLLAVATSKGEIKLPVVLGSMTTDDEMVFVVAGFDGTSVPSSVPVRLATLDPHSNVYKSYSPDGSSILMTWTPIVKETDASTTLPSSVPNIVLYEGGTPWATTSWLGKDPDLEGYDFGNGFVTVFPVESGIPPIYTVFNNSSEWASAEEARKAAEAEILRIAQAQALEQVLAGGAYPISGATAAAGPAFTLAGSSLVISSEATLAIQAALRAAVAMAIESLTAVAVPTLAGFAALLYSPKLANGELPERYAFSTPLSELAPIQHHDFHAIAAADGVVDLPVRLTSQATVDGQSEILVINTDGITHPSKVKVVPVTYNAQQNLYIATTEQTPPRTLMWTPVVQPGNSSTALPAEPPAPPVYTGASVTPIEGRIDPFPEVTANSFDDYVFVFPIDSGLPPLYVMFRDRREDPGVALGTGAPVSGVWTDAASKGEGAAIPSQIADQLRGKEFRNFRKFREAFWKAVAGDPILSQQFDPGSLAHMKNGYGAFVKKNERVGARIKYELHHKQYISMDGEVYHLENIRLMTPRKHIQTHRENKI